MTYAQAKETVIEFAAADAWPTLSPSSVELALSRARRVDVNGRRFGDAAYIPTYDENAALAFACALKAVKAGSKYDVQSQGETQRRSQVAEFWKGEAKRYRGMTTVSLKGYGTALTTQGTTIAGIYVPIDASDV